MRTSLFLFMVCSVLSLGANGQNLVYNPSFEQFTHCPEHLGSFDQDVLHWSAPTAGSTDYFNGCSEAMGTPENFNGRQNSAHGSGYAGIYLYAPDDYREYLQASLITNLVEGERYTLSFYVSLAERSDYAISDFSVCLSDKPVHTPIKKALTKMQLFRLRDHQYTFLEIKNGEYLADSRDWYRVSADFVARGKERYLIIGNLKNNRQTRKHHLKRRAKQGAYYYIDQVELRPANSGSEDLALSRAVGQSSRGEIYRLDTTHTFRDVLFQFDDHGLTETARAELRRVYDFLKADPELHICINGHTDRVGTDSYNLRLSRKRCQSVVAYLKKLGLERERIRWTAHGSRAPVADNESEDGRRRNRRVEFVFSHPAQDQ